MPSEVADALLSGVAAAVVPGPLSAAAGGGVQLEVASRSLSLATLRVNLKGFSSAAVAPAFPLGCGAALWLFLLRDDTVIDPLSELLGALVFGFLLWGCVMFVDLRRLEVRDTGSFRRALPVPFFRGSSSETSFSSSKM